jgi:hypothetical protein
MERDRHPEKHPSQRIATEEGIQIDFSKQQLLNAFASIRRK